jgi:hypothetical protein
VRFHILQMSYIWGNIIGIPKWDILSIKFFSWLLISKQKGFVSLIFNSVLAHLFIQILCNVTKKLLLLHHQALKSVEFRNWLKFETRNNFHHSRLYLEPKSKSKREWWQLYLISNLSQFVNSTLFSARWWRRSFFETLHKI